VKEYQNPIATNGDFADPFVLKHNGKYYLYCTNPDIRCWSSRDLINWSLEGPTISENLFQGLVPFAPEVVYANGSFYMYTSPSGFGHYVLESKNPTGPFLIISENIGHSIDGSVFIDDDGKWYFYWAGDEGIWGCEMKSPTEFGEPVLTGAFIHGWTEGPLIHKKEGRYYMTYTGNHYLSKGYRINAAWSNHPLMNYVDDIYNPIIIHTEGEVTGLGHSSSIQGPDLVSNYIIYHNMNDDASRDLDIDRQLWYQDVTQILGPTRTLQQVPLLPDFTFLGETLNEENHNLKINKDNILEFICVKGSLERSKEVHYSNEGDFFAFSKQKFLGDFTAEFNLIISKNSFHGGIILAESEKKYYSFEFDQITNSIQVWQINNEKRELLKQSELPADYKMDALHQVRIERTDIVLIRLYLDNRMQIDAVKIDLKEIKIGYITENGKIGCGYTAISEKTSENEEIVIPLDCYFSPVFGTGNGKKNDDGSLYLDKDSFVEFIIHVDKAANYKFIIASRNLENESIFTLMCDQTYLGNGSGNAAIQDWHINLGAGNHKLKIQCTCGALLIGRLKILTLEEGTLGDKYFQGRISQSNCFESLKIGPYGKKIAKLSKEENYCIKVNFTAHLLEEGSAAGILLRVTEPSEGGEGSDAILGINFFIGYSVSIRKDKLVISRHRYDEVIIGECPFEYNNGEKYFLQIEIEGSKISAFYQNSVSPFLTVFDEEPIMDGKVGIWAKNSIVRVRDFIVEDKKS